MSVLLPLLALALAHSDVPTPDDLALSLLTQEALHAKKRERSEVLCLEVDGRDASKSILSALASQYNVVGGSYCQRSMQGSFLKATHDPATFVSVKNFRRLPSGHAEVQVDVYRNGLWAIYETREVGKAGDTWLLIRVKSHREA